MNFTKVYIPKQKIPAIKNSIKKSLISNEDFIFS